MESPRLGQRRSVPRFAWWPVHLSGEPWYRGWIHLRWYEAHQVFREPEDAEPWGSLQSRWETTARHPDRTTASAS